MTTKPQDSLSEGIKTADEDILIKKIYDTVDEFKEFIPVDNDRNRLSFTLNLFFSKEIDTLENAVIQAQPRSSIIMYSELAGKLNGKFKEKGLL
ncbi:MAG: hypothetical protein NTV87_03240 [Ignavibacteriae bacterium]|jgi:hypothetical protein|nr:hypothetical protein [Ignavibacteriota bacterium]